MYLVVPPRAGGHPIISRVGFYICPMRKGEVNNCEFLLKLCSKYFDLLFLSPVLAFAHSRGFKFSVFVSSRRIGKNSYTMPLHKYESILLKLYQLTCNFALNNVLGKYAADLYLVFHISITSFQIHTISLSLVFHFKILPLSMKI